MDEETDRIADLESRIVALQRLVLSHILASEALDPGVAAATADIAKGQVDALRADGSGRAAVRLKLLLESIGEVAREIPAND